MTQVEIMARAVEMAQTASSPFVALIVDREKGTILAEGHNQTERSPTLHAEIDAINCYASVASQLGWSEVDLYTTAEPCPMCQGAIEFAGIGTVHYGSSIPWLQQQGWWQIDLRAQDVARHSPSGGARIIGGVLAAQCDRLFTRTKEDR